MAEPFYAARSRRDPAWRLRAIAGAREPKRRLRERDPEAFRARQREANARTFAGRRLTGSRSRSSCTAVRRRPAPGTAGSATRPCSGPC